MTADRAPAGTSIRRWLVRAVVALLACLGVLLLLVVFRIVPPITGRVTDALTEEAIGGVTVALEIERYEGFSSSSVVRNVSPTNRFGWFWLGGFVKWRRLPIPDFGDYWLTVNQVPEPSFGHVAFAATQILYNPMSNRTGQHVGNTRYFPVTVTFGRNGCDRVWSAACVYRPFWWGVSIPLIPVLDDVEQCKTARDAPLRERCRQLNTYRAAFLHVDTFHEAQRSKRLCAEVDGDGISATCLTQVPVYAANPDAYGRAALQPDAEPRLGGLFPDAIGDTVRSRQDCDPGANYLGHLQCSAIYVNDSPEPLVTVTVEEWVDRSSPPVETLQGKPYYEDYLRATVVREARPDGIIRMYRGPENIAADWASKNRYVRVFFHRRIAAQDMFIAHYLSTFPSTLQ